jgi:hypothetical protein
VQWERGEDGEDGEDGGGYRGKKCTLSQMVIVPHWSVFIIFMLWVA